MINRFYHLLDLESALEFHDLNDNDIHDILHSYHFRFEMVFITWYNLLCLLLLFDFFYGFLLMSDVSTDIFHLRDSLESFFGAFILKKFSLFFYLAYSCI